MERLSVLENYRKQIDNFSSVVVSGVPVGNYCYS